MYKSIYLIGFFHDIFWLLSISIHILCITFPLDFNMAQSRQSMHWHVCMVASNQDSQFIRSKKDTWAVQFRMVIFIIWIADTKTVQCSTFKKNVYKSTQQIITKCRNKIDWFLVAVQTFKKMIKIELCIDVLYIFISLNRWGSRY